MRTLGAFVLFAVGATATLEKFQRNLGYSSPFTNDPQFGYDVVELSRRSMQPVRRDVVDASKFKDEVYPGFYTSDTSNALNVWSSGVNFTHSVASGDPFDKSVILWTRAVPLPAADGSLPDQSVPVCISFTISSSNDLSHPVDSGEAFSSYDVDFTVKVEATGLKPDSSYFYQFADCTNPSIKSPVGRTRTLPSPNTPADRVNGGKPLTLAVFSCSQFQAGWFNAYGFVTHNLSADIFIHLGDYIYESIGNGGPIGRVTLGRELATIADYRQRLGQYRTDASLVEAHQNHPWITDDHEVADNAWKAGTTDSNDTAAGCKFSPSGACFTDRKFAGVRAYHEWMPIRQVDARNQLRIWRNFQIGKLLDLTMLDTRQYNRDVTDVGYNRLIQSIVNEENRSLMGADQEKWLSETLLESKNRGAVWRVLGQQIVFTHINDSGFSNGDSWDGYRANRNRILDFLYKNHVDNVVITSGDSHANWVSDLAHMNDPHYDPKTGTGAIGVEFAGTAVTSSATFDLTQQPIRDAGSRNLVTFNDDLQWQEQFWRGCFTLTIDSKNMVATYYGMRNVSFANLDGFPIATFHVKAGENRLTRPVANGTVQAGALKSVVLGF